MINKFGKWEEEKDYNNISQEHWCDMDYMAAWIRRKDYEIKTTMENLILMIFAHYEGDDEFMEKGYFAVEDARKYPDNLMVNIPDVEAYVEASGGLAEFDYYC